MDTVENILIFSRLLSFDDFTISTGASFAFPPGMEDKLIRECKREMRQIKSGSKAIKRFSSFYQLNKKHGLDVLPF